MERFSILNNPGCGQLRPTGVPEPSGTVFMKRPLPIASSSSVITSAVYLLLSFNQSIGRAPERRKKATRGHLEKSLPCQLQMYNGGLCTNCILIYVMWAWHLDPLLLATGSERLERKSWTYKKSCPPCPFDHFDSHSALDNKAFHSSSEEG